MSILLEERLRAGEVVDAALGAAGDLAGDQRLHALDGLGVVADDLVDLLGEEVAHGALDEVRAPGRSRRAPGVASRFAAIIVPLLQQHAEVADEVAGALAGGHGAHDDAHALGHAEFLDDLAQAGALLGILDLAGDAALLVVAA